MVTRILGPDGPVWARRTAVTGALLVLGSVVGLAALAALRAVLR